MFWPAWLQHEQGLSQFRIFTFGYNANFRGPDTSLSILDFAKGLLVRMRGYGNDESGGDTPLGKVCGHELSLSGPGGRHADNVGHSDPSSSSLTLWVDLL
jgi:hypothetical protein